MTTATVSNVLLRACPRCHGDLFLDGEENTYGCLQCGRHLPSVHAGAWAAIDALLANEMSPNNRRLRLLPAPTEEEWNNDAA